MGVGLAEKTNRWSINFSEGQGLALSSREKETHGGDTRVEGLGADAG